MTLFGTSMYKSQKGPICQFSVLLCRMVSIIRRRLGTSFPASSESDRVSTRPPKGHSLPDAPRPINSVLVANRGEIAIRICRACAELGIKTIGIFSEIDRHSAHRFRANEAYLVGKGKAPVAAYLDIQDIVRIAKERKADAIHPGYGFLAENAEFASAVIEAGITFVGPDPDILEMLGDKTVAKKTAVDAGINVVPGSQESLHEAAGVAAFVEEHGLPIIVKAAFGGGGRGMRVIHEADKVEELFNMAQSEAVTAFGNGAMLIERYIENPKHIEVQLLGDGEGNVVHLFERDCSIQRRHQKLLEFAPSLSISEEMQNTLQERAVALGKHVKYKNAGTVEFLCDENNYYFMEVNPRLQVEHTVSEEITGIDIVENQLLIAQGYSLEELGLAQKDIRVNGYAIQCRITAEDPTKDFLPSAGRIEEFKKGEGTGIRIDAAMDYAGAKITGAYDSLICKVIVRARTFCSAVRKAQRVLEEFRIGGVKTNIRFLLNVLENKDFADGNIDTSFIETHPEVLSFATHVTPSYNIVRFVAEQLVNGPLTPHMTTLQPISYKPFFPSEIKTDPESPVRLSGKICSGWRDVLLTEGPEGFARAVRDHKGLLLMDTTFRDAHQSLLATRVRTYDLLRACPFVARNLHNLFALENWGGATFDVAMRFLYECPWERLESMRALIPNIPFQMLLRASSAVGYTNYPDNVLYKFCELAVKSGMDIFRIFDALNYVPNIEIAINAVRDAGGVVEAAMCYTGDVVSPIRRKYDLDYYLNLSRELVKMGIHILAIKDMAGLLKPYSAHVLISALREEHPDLPIHLHTHDTAGNGVASMLAAARAGVDIVDVACDSMSGMTSQPSMGAIIAGVEGTYRSSDIDLRIVSEYSAYWEQTRLLYGPFESAVAMKSSSSEVFDHEIPGGQYTNLQFQAFSLGLGARFVEVKTAYKEANMLLGDIIKVTPSSKVVGDLAQFMVANHLRLDDVLQQAETLNFPLSVIEYLQGFIGQPYGGFPEPFRSDVLKDMKRLEGRPGSELPPLDFDELRTKLSTEFPYITDQKVVSSAIYPVVTHDFLTFRENYGDVSILDTRTFLAGTHLGETVDIVTAPGTVFSVKLLAKSQDLKKDGTRTVFFDVKGHLRSVTVKDKKAISKLPVHPKVDKLKPGQVGAPMNGTVVNIQTEVGNFVDNGTPLLTISAMKMEMIIRSPVIGHVTTILVKPGMMIATDDLLVLIDIEHEKDIVR